MSDYDQADKKIVFSDSARSHAEFRIKLQYDGLTQKSFFREVIAAYLNEDELFIEFLHSMKDRLSAQSKRQRELVKKERAGAKSKKRDFLLNDEEVENIFDLLERETGL